MSMSTEQTDRVIASIDRALTSDEITDIVDEQLARYDQRTGYDYSVGQPQCGHCGANEHHLATTERIEHMRQCGIYDESYRYDEDTTRVFCPGTFVPGPVGFRPAHARALRLEERRTRAGAGGGFSPGGRIPPGPGGVVSVRSGEAWTEIGSIDGCAVSFRPLDQDVWARFREALSAASSALAPRLGDLVDTAATALAPFVEQPVPEEHPERLTVRLITSDGRPIHLSRSTRVTTCEHTSRGFTIELDGRFGRSFGVPHRILLEGPGGPRERIAGIVTGLSSTVGGPIRITAESEHRRLPTVYTESEN